MTMKAGMLFQPSFNQGVIVRTIVVQNHVNIKAIGGVTVDLSQKFSKFDIAVSRITRTNDVALQHIECRKQTSGTIALVIMRHRSAAALFHRQSRLSTVQRLYLRLFIHAQNDCFVRWVQVHAYHVRQLFNKPLVPRELKAFHTVRLQPMCIPDARDGGIANSHDPGHRPCGPMRRIRGSRMQSGLYNLFNPFRRQSPRTHAVGSIFRQSLWTSLLKALAPLQNRWTTGLQVPCDDPIGHTFCCKQANSRTQYSPLWTGFRTHPSLQGFTLGFCHWQFFGWLPHEALYNTKSYNCKVFT